MGSYFLVGNYKRNQYESGCKQPVRLCAGLLLFQLSYHNGNQPDIRTITGYRQALQKINGNNRTTYKAKNKRNFQTIQQGSISKANDNSFIKLSEVSLDNLDRLTSYDMVFINGMGLRIVEEQRQQIQQAADKGIPVYTSMATNPANNICNLDSIQQNLIRGYLSNGGKTNYRNMLNYIRKAIDGKASVVPEVEDPT